MKRVDTRTYAGIFLFFLFCFFPGSLRGAEEIPPHAETGYDRLLAGYLAHDTEGIKLELEKEQAARELERYALETGTALTVSSGDTVFSFSPSGMKVSANPGIELGFPRLRNTSLSVAAPLQGQGDGLTRYGMDLSVKTSILSGQSGLYRAELAERERAFLVALRKEASRRLAAEKEFCGAIKQLLAYQNAMLEARGETILARYDLESKRAGGYAASAVILRTAELKLRTREREQGEAERTLETALRKFAGDCGVEKAGVPENIPEEPLRDILSFDPARYIELEDALKTHALNNMTRSARDHPVTLEGNAGYSWRNDGGPPGSVGGANAGSSLRAGAGLSTGGIRASAGIALPLEKPNEPSLTLSFQWKPGGAKLFNLDKQLRDIAAARERGAITQAEKKYRDLVTEYDRKKADLLWQKESYQEEAELYRINAEDLALWFQRGIIRETEYLGAKTDYLRAANRVFSARIDRWLYNLDLRTLFVSAVLPMEAS